MGEAFETNAAPKLTVKIAGTDRITAVDIVRNKNFIYHSAPGTNSVEFTYVDNSPAVGESYYYVRVMQIDRNLAWSSPVWLTYKAR